jgi:hypothetical protein
MGLGDFLGGIGDAIVPEAVEDMAGAAVHGVGSAATGLVHGVEAFADTAGTLAQGAGWALDPHHWDDIQHGIGAAGSFIGQHPGQAWDMAFEVGRHVVKEEILDPKNLAINLGLLAATTLTGGGAGAAWIAKLGEGARAGIGAVRAARGIEEVGALSRGARAAGAAMAASETAWKAARVERAALSGVRAGEAVSEATSVLGRAAEKVTDVAEFMPRQFAAARKAITGNELGVVARGRAGLAGAFEGSSPGIAREAIGDVIRGSKFAPAVAEGQAGGRLAQASYSFHRGSANVSHVQATRTAGRAGEEIYQFERNPEAYLTKKAGLAGVDVGALKAGWNTLKGAKKLKDELGENPTEDKPKSKYVADYGDGGFAAPTGDMPAYPTGNRQSQRLGTSQEQYVESDFAVDTSRLGHFYQGMYQDRSIYDTAGAR